MIRINYQRIVNNDGEAEITNYYDDDMLSNPPDMIDAKNKILEVMKENDILIVKATNYNLDKKNIDKKDTKK